MCVGKPKWNDNLRDWDLEDLFGFAQAYVVRPEGLKRPILPYHSNESGGLIFPAGKFFGVYCT
jgi:hypothetical protein